MPKCNLYKYTKNVSFKIDFSLKACQKVIHNSDLIVFTVLDFESLIVNSGHLTCNFGEYQSPLTSKSEIDVIC